MIVAVIQAEKTERQRRKVIQKITEGYDADKEVKVDCNISGDKAFTTSGVLLEIAEPSTGTHQMSERQKMYEEASKFLARQVWQVPSKEAKAAGIAWIELFVLFDIEGGRTEEGRYRKDAKAAKRADERMAKGKKRRRAGIDDTAEVKASLGEELKRLKQICRFIGRQDMHEEHAEVLKVKEKTRYRRLKGLGVNGHQPCMKGNCIMGAASKERVEEAIFRQKYGTTAKAIKAFIQYKERGVEGEVLLAKMARLDTRSCPRWKRERAPGAPTQAPITMLDEEPSTYATRPIRCGVCNHGNETAAK